MAPMGQHSAPLPAPGRADKIIRLARAMKALLKAPGSAGAKDEVSRARHGCTEDEYEEAWAVVQRDEERAVWRPKLPVLRNRAGSWQVIAVAVLVGLIAGGLAVYTAAASYDTVSHLAALKHVALPRLNPLGIDGGVIGMIVIDTVLTARGEPIWWLRWFIRVFAAGMIGANAAAGWPDLVGTGLRVGAPALFVIITETFRTWLLRRQRAAERADKKAARAARKAARAERRAGMKAARKERRGDRIPADRWLLDFRGTASMWRRMRLWREPSYEKAVAMELERLAAIEKLAVEYGAETWQEKVPADLVWMLKSGVRMNEALTRVGELLAGQERDRALEAELRSLRASVSAQAASARGEREAEVSALHAALESARSDAESARGEAVEALALVSELEQKLAAASARKKRPKTAQSAPAARVSALDSDPTTELRAVMELRDHPELLGPRKGGELAERLGIGASTARRLRASLVKDGALSEYAQSLMEAPVERSQ